jgi:hypothetical protein
MIIIKYFLPIFAIFIELAECIPTKTTKEATAPASTLKKQYDATNPPSNGASKPGPVYSAPKVLDAAGWAKFHELEAKRTQQPNQVDNLLLFESQ